MRIGRRGAEVRARQFAQSGASATPQEPAVQMIYNSDNYCVL